MDVRLKFRNASMLFSEMCEFKDTKSYWVSHATLSVWHQAWLPISSGSSKYVPKSIVNIILNWDLCKTIILWLLKRGTAKEVYDRVTHPLWELNVCFGCQDKELGA